MTKALTSGVNSLSILPSSNTRASLHVHTARKYINGDEEKTD